MPELTKARMRQALEWIGTDCERYTGNERCPDNGRKPDAVYDAIRWCDGCIAAYGLGKINYG